jgi:soluble lytic murein transglycosylase
MSERGDPRDPAVDVVDWIESIPFDETRNYIMRVAESLPVYRARLGGAAGAVRFRDELTAR